MKYKRWTKRQILKQGAQTFEVITRGNIGEEADFCDNELKEFTNFREALSYARKQYKSGQCEYVSIELCKLGYLTETVWYNGKYDYYEELQQRRQPK